MKLNELGMQTLESQKLYSELLQTLNNAELSTEGAFFSTPGFG